jgi:hypothetical protein
VSSSKVATPWLSAAFRTPGPEAEESSTKYATISVEYLVGIKEE